MPDSDLQSCDTWSHLAEGVEDTVQHNEEREDALNWVECTSDDEAQDRPAEETKRHGLLASDLVHQKSTHDAAWEIETVLQNGQHMFRYRCSETRRQEQQAVPQIQMCLKLDIVARGGNIASSDCLNSSWRERVNLRRPCHSRCSESSYRWGSAAR